MDCVDVDDDVGGGDWVKPFPFSIPLPQKTKSHKMIIDLCGYTKNPNDIPATEQSVT